MVFLTFAFVDLFGEVEKVHLSGRIQSGADVEHYERGRTIHDAKLNWMSELQPNSKGYISLIKETNQPDITLKECYIRGKLDEDNTLDFGFAKKPFGLNYYLSENERKTIKSSRIYEKLESFGYIGDESTLRVFQNTDKERSFGYLFSLGYDESLESNLIFSLYKDSDQGDPNFGFWFLLQSDRINNKRVNVWSLALAVWSHSNTATYEVEVIGGVDPFDSEYNELFADGRKVYFAGISTLYSYKFDLLEPLLQLTYLLHDDGHKGYDTYEILSGINYHFSSNFKLALNMTETATNSKEALGERSYDESYISLQARLYF